MEIRQLELTQFRNYQKLSIEFPAGVNIFIGKNGQGKTNLLEAISLLSGSGSLRDARDPEMLQWQTECYRIKASGSNQHRAFAVEISYSRAAPKTVRINGLPLSRLSELALTVNTVVFSPEDLALVKGPPVQRRRFLDREICQASPVYATGLSRYHKVLLQRNAVLRRIKEGIGGVKELDPWDEQLAPLAAAVLTRRLTAVGVLARHARQIYRELSGGSEALEVTYQPSFSLPPEPERWPAVIKEQLDRHRPADIARQVTLRGPHRDELQLYLDGRLAKIFASQGQQRTVALALKLAEIAFVRQYREESPLVLLDDVFSELDPGRGEQLLNFLRRSPAQLFLSTTHPLGFLARLTGEVDIFRVEAGQVYPWEDRRL